VRYYNKPDRGDKGVDKMAFSFTADAGCEYGAGVTCHGGSGGPKQYVTWWAEAGYRHSDVPYWSGRGGITPPGGNNGAPADYTCSSGSSSGQTVLAAAYAACGGPGSVWFPDLRRGQASLSAGVMVKF
jgi:hypothetical protein